MTGLTETEYLVAALECGGGGLRHQADQTRRKCWRAWRVHLAGARERRQTRNALDAFGYASITVRLADGCLLWQTPLARELLQRYCGTQAPQTPGSRCWTWLRQCAGRAWGWLASRPAWCWSRQSTRLSLRLAPAHRRYGRWWRLADRHARGVRHGGASRPCAWASS